MKISKRKYEKVVRVTHFLPPYSSICGETLNEYNELCNVHSMEYYLKCKKSQEIKKKKKEEIQPGNVP